MRNLKILKKQQKYRPTPKIKKSDHKNQSEKSMNSGLKIIQSTNKSKSWLFKRINKINNLLAKFTKRRRKIFNNAIRNEKVEIITEAVTTMKKQYYSKLKNFEEMDSYKLLKITQEATKVLNNSIQRNETDTVIKNLANKKSPGPNAFDAESYKTFTDIMSPILFKFFKEMKRDRVLPYSLMKAKITLIPKLDKDLTNKNKTYGTMPY